MRGTQGFVIVFGVTNRASFDKCLYWLQFAADNGTSCTPQIVVVGTKADLATREVAQKEAQAFFAGRGVPYYEVSARTGQGVEDVFSLIATESLGALCNENCNENAEYDVPMCR